MTERAKNILPWAKDRGFAELYFSLHRNRLLAMPPERAFSLWNIAKSVEDVPGCIVELGVYRGGSAFLLGKALPDRPLHLFDSFQGLPEPSPHDLHKAGDFSKTSLEKTKELLGFTKSVFHVGYFPETFGDFSSPIALIHLDADLYESTKKGLESFWPLVSAGGTIIGDDYGWHHCPGVKTAFDEFCAQKKLSLELPASYQCLIRKE